jgi:D-alanine-D-alanine ligase
MSRLRVGLLFGGRSVEHEVSITSATSILAALDRQRYEIQLLAIDPQGGWHLGSPDLAPADVVQSGEIIFPPNPGRPTLLDAAGAALGPEGELDVVFSIVHGKGGEDGSLQGLFDLADIAYVGSGVLSTSLQMDKDLAKRLLQAAGLPVVPWLTFRGEELCKENIPDIARTATRKLGDRLFVKPSNSGSSVGIDLAEDFDQLVRAIEDASRYDTKVLIEQAVDAREIEVAVLGNDSPEASVPGELRMRGRFYDYESKYQDDATELVIPAELPENEATEIRRLAVEAFRVLDAAGLARVDFLKTRDEGTLYINELNSLPGFTEVSMYPKLWQATGLPYSELLDRLIELALERQRRRSKLVTSR